MAPDSETGDFSTPNEPQQASTPSETSVATSAKEKTENHSKEASSVELQVEAENGAAALAQAPKTNNKSQISGPGKKVKRGFDQVNLFDKTSNSEDDGESSIGIRHDIVLEKRVQLLEKFAREIQNKDLTPHKEKSRLKPTHVHEISYLEWSKFEIKPLIRSGRKKWEHGDNVDTSPHSILEVLLEEPNTNFRRKFRTPKQGTHLQQEYQENRLKTDAIVADRSKTPARVRIRSPLLLKILAKFLGRESIDSDAELMTMLHPFKLLVTRRDQIKKYLQDLEKKHRHGSDATIEPRSEDYALASHSNTPGTIHRQEQSDAILSNDRATNGSKEIGPLEETESEEALQHLRVLVRFIDEDLSHIFILRQRIKDRTQKTIAFSDLWHLFEYGQEVRTSENQNLQLYKVVTFTGGRQLINWAAEPSRSTAAAKFDEHSQGAFCLQCYSLDFNGSHYGTKDTIFLIRGYEGEKNITDLSCYPLAFDPHAEEIRDVLLNRGAEFTKLSGRDRSKYRHKQYTGLTVDKETEQVDSEVIIDFEWAFYRKPEWKPALVFKHGFSHDMREVNIPSADLGTCGRESCCGNDYIFKDYAMDEAAFADFQRGNKDVSDLIDSAEELDNEEKALLPPTAFGFVLRSRKWAAFAIKMLTDVSFNTDGWRNLELPVGHKETVHALVKTHAGGDLASRPTDTFSTMDLVKGKGKGLIILLHGAPGVGKTSTAECIAELTKRPLFSITCGDIGDNAYHVEDHLEDNFQLAHRWGCVLLLDEADVFLQKRDMRDLARNSIVSVFLRTLEYYSGILFLTTNRVGKIDPAFKSRIHLSLFYPILDLKKTVAIWRNHLRRVKAQFNKETRDFDIDREDIIKFSKSHFRRLKSEDKTPWNGRQIRNAWQTAIAIAEFEASERSQPYNQLQLKSSQFEKVAKTADEFDDYLKRVWGGKDESEVARVEQARNDEIMDEQRGQARMLRPTFVSTGKRARKNTIGKRETAGEDMYGQQNQVGKAISRRPTATASTDNKADGDDDDNYDDDDDDDDGEDGETEDEAEED